MLQCERALQCEHQMKISVRTSTQIKAKNCEYASMDGKRMACLRTVICGGVDSPNPATVSRSARKGMWRNILFNGCNL